MVNPVSLVFCHNDTWWPTWVNRCSQAIKLAAFSKPFLQHVLSVAIIILASNALHLQSTNLISNIAWALHGPQPISHRMLAAMYRVIRVDPCLYPLVKSSNHRVSNGSRAKIINRMCKITDWRWCKNSNMNEAVSGFKGKYWTRILKNKRCHVCYVSISKLLD